MKSNSADILAALNNENVGIFFLVHLEWANDHFLTTLPYEITWNGNIYKSETNILSFESPRSTTVVDRQAYKVRLSGLDPDIQAEVEASIIHKPVRIKLGFLQDGIPNLGLDKLMHVYSGTVANVKKTINQGEQAFVVECSAPLSDLDAKSTLFTTKDGIRQFDASDTSFDQVAEGSSEYSLNWGKKEAARTPPPIPSAISGFFDV